MAKGKGNVTTIVIVLILAALAAWYFFGGKNGADAEVATTNCGALKAYTQCTAEKAGLDAATLETTLASFDSLTEETCKVTIEGYAQMDGSTDPLGCEYPVAVEITEDDTNMLEEALDDAGEAIEDVADDAVDTVEEVASDVEEVVEDAVEDAQEAVENTVEEVVEATTTSGSSN